MILTMLHLSDSFSRRYTPQTCTLEINAQTSALSRWSRQPVLKQLQFHLSFDNLLRSNDQPVQVSGDRTQLDALCEAVESYVQQLLNQFPTDQQSPLPESPAIADQPDSFESTTSQDGTAQITGALATMPESETQGIYLKSRNRLSHDLFLGSLMTETSGSVISLSTSQLFDLASALEEYAAESTALPKPKQQSPIAWVRGTPLWAQTAAIAVVAVGITTAALQLANNSNPISQKPSAGDMSSGQATPTQIAPPPMNAGKAQITPPPPPPGSTPLPPSDLSTVPLPSTLPNPSDLPNIEPPPDRSTSSGKTTSKSESKSAANKTVNPSAIPSAGNQIIAVQPRYPTVSQTTAAGKAATKSKTSGASNDSTVGITSGSTSQSEQLQETAFDTVPQIAEVRSYFQKTWLPPKGLKQSLQYTLILSPNGSIERALPRGQAADTYLDRTPIPLANEPFFTPIKSGDRPKVRLVLGPDGSVKTFLEESSN